MWPSHCGRSVMQIENRHYSQNARLSLCILAVCVRDERRTALCRTAALLDALGEPGMERCGTCDNCRGTAIRGEAVAQGVA